MFYQYRGGSMAHSNLKCAISKMFIFFDNKLYLLVTNSGFQNTFIFVF